MRRRSQLKLPNLRLSQRRGRCPRPNRQSRRDHHPRRRSRQQGGVTPQYCLCSWIRIVGAMTTSTIWQANNAVMIKHLRQSTGLKLEGYSGLDLYRWRRLRRVFHGWRFRWPALRLRSKSVEAWCCQVRCISTLHQVLCGIARSSGGSSGHWSRTQCKVVKGCYFTALPASTGQRASRCFVERFSQENHCWRRRTTSRRWGRSICQAWCITRASANGWLRCGGLLCWLHLIRRW